MGHTIRKVKFLSKKFSFEKTLEFFSGNQRFSTTKKCKSPTFSRVFHPKYFWQFFSWNQSCQQLKSPKPQHFHEFFTPKKSTNFSGNQSWIFGQKMKISNSVLLSSTYLHFLLLKLFAKWMDMVWFLQKSSFFLARLEVTDWCHATAGWCGFSISQGLSKWNGNGCFKATKFTLCTQRQC